MMMTTVACTNRVFGRRDVDGAVQGLSDQADLSDRTFKALDDKAARLRKLKVPNRLKLTAIFVMPIKRGLCTGTATVSLLLKPKMREGF